MPYNKQYILALFAVLSILFTSCQKSDLLGLNDDTSLNKSSVTTSTVDVSTVQEPIDSVITSNLAQHPFGYLNDPVLGQTEANLALALNLPSSSFSFGTGAEIDSAVLVLKYGTEFYGDSAGVSTYNINVHELDTVLTAGTYNAKKAWKFTQTVVGSKQVKRFAWNDSVSVKQVVDGAADPNKNVTPHLRIPLSATTIFNDLKSALAKDSVTSTGFQKYFKGLYLTINKSALPTVGGITFFDLASSGNISGLEVYYRNKTSAGAADTNMVLFSASSAQAASNIVQTHSAAVKALEGNVNVNEVYVQPLAGYRVKVRFTGIEALRALAPANGSVKKTIAINKAELIIPEVAADTSIFKPARRLALYRTDIAGVRQPVPDNAIGMDARYLSEPIFGGFYDSKNRQYKFNITSYIQDLVSGKLKQYDTYIAPIRPAFTGLPNISSSATTAKRSILAGKNNAGQKITLKILYTIPD